MGKGTWDDPRDTAAERAAVEAELHPRYHVIVTATGPELHRLGPGCSSSESAPTPEGAWRRYLDGAKRDRDEAAVVFRQASARVDAAVEAITKILRGATYEISSAEGTVAGTLEECCRWQAEYQGAYARVSRMTSTLEVDMTVDVDVIKFDPGDVGAAVTVVLQAFAEEEGLS